MKLQLATLLTLVLISSAVQAQFQTQVIRPGQPQPKPFCGTPRPIVNPPIVDPAPAPSFFLGVQVSTVEVEAYGRAQPVNQPRLLVAPGAGQAVYGQRVNRVVPNSPAAQAGLEPGDIILDANGFPMDSGNDLQHAINTSQGRMEMKVIDSRTGRMVWVTANTNPQNSVPMAAPVRTAPRVNATPQVLPARPKVSTTRQNLTRRVLNAAITTPRGPIFRGGR